MYNERIEALISAALADGKLTEKEKQILFKNAEAEGIDLDEFEMILDARLVELEKAKEEATKSAPKSNKLGDVRKCPACGALVNSFHRKCQECGYVFENITANYSVTKLLDSLRLAKNNKKRAEIISLFPMPSSRGELLEFITVFHPKVLNNDGTLLSSTSGDSNAYLTKYKECLEKIRIYFPEDITLNKYVTDFDNAVKAKVKADRKELKADILRVLSDASPYIIYIVSLISSLIIAHYNDWGYTGMGIVGSLVGGAIAVIVSFILTLVRKDKDKEWAEKYSFHLPCASFVLAVFVSELIAYNRDYSVWGYIGMGLLGIVIGIVVSIVMLILVSICENQRKD